MLSRPSSQLVSRIGDLGLQVSALLRLVVLGVGAVVFRLVFDDPLPHFPGQIQAREVRVSIFQLRDDAQRLLVVVKAPVVAHQPRKGNFAGVTEGRVPQVVRQRDRLQQILVRPQCARHSPADLRHLQGVRQAGTVIIPLVVHENLGLVLQAPKGRGVQYPIAVALEGSAERRLLFGVLPPFRVPATHPIGRQGLDLGVFEFYSSDEHGSGV